MDKEVKVTKEAVLVEYVNALREADFVCEKAKQTALQVCQLKMKMVEIKDAEEALKVEKPVEAPPA